jgi:hypothetical protein
VTQSEILDIGRAHKPLSIEIVEAAIGIEPMNKGFAVLAKLFAQVQPCSLLSVFISVFDISSSRGIAQIWVCYDQ